MPISVKDLYPQWSHWCGRPSLWWLNKCVWKALGANMHTQCGHWIFSCFPWILALWLDISLSVIALNSQLSSLQQNGNPGSWCTSSCLGVVTSLHSLQISLFFLPMPCFSDKCLFKAGAECVLKSQRSHKKGKRALGTCSWWQLFSFLLLFPSAAVQSRDKPGAF